MKLIKFFTNLFSRFSLKKTENNETLKIFVNSFLVGSILGISTFFWFGEKLDTPLKLKFLSFFNKNQQETNFIAKVTKKCTPSIVTIDIQDPLKLDTKTNSSLTVSTGTGFLIKSNGWIVTNAHNVIRKSNFLINVTTSDGSCHLATLEAIDILLDLALLKICKNNMPIMHLGNSEEVYPGEFVVAIGSPKAPKNTITVGVVSSVNRDAKELGIKNVSISFIQTDAQITSEHSGGPLVNMKGNVVGVNNLKATPGIAFAIPVDYVKEFLIKSLSRIGDPDDYETNNHLLNKTRFGVTVLPATPEILKKYLNKSVFNLINLRGLVVWKVEPESIAYDVGILEGDIITHINEEPIISSRDLDLKLFILACEYITLTIIRKGQYRNIIIPVLDIN